MKKIMLSFMAVCLLMNTVAFTAAPVMSPKRLFLCGTAPDKNKCTKEERDKSRRWFIGVPVAVLLAAAAIAGVTLTASKAKQIQEEKKSEVAAQEAMDTTRNEKINQYTQIGLDIKRMEQDIKDLTNTIQQDTQRMRHVKGDASGWESKIKFEEDQLKELNKKLEQLRQDQLRANQNIQNVR